MRGVGDDCWDCSHTRAGSPPLRQASTLNFINRTRPSGIAGGRLTAAATAAERLTDAGDARNALLRDAKTCGAYIGESDSIASPQSPP
jgi:hypothetical protein